MEVLTKKITKKGNVIYKNNSDDFRVTTALNFKIL